MCQIFSDEPYEPIPGRDNVYARFSPDHEIVFEIRPEVLGKRQTVLDVSNRCRVEITEAGRVCYTALGQTASTTKSLQVGKWSKVIIRADGKGNVDFTIDGEEAGGGQVGIPGRAVDSTSLTLGASAKGKDFLKAALDNLYIRQLSDTVLRKP